MEQNKKSEVRKAARQKRDGLAPDWRTEASRAISERVCALSEVREAGSIFLYCAFRSEVETPGLASRLLEMGKTVCVPLCQPKSRDMLAIRIDNLSELAPGAFGIPEPEYGEDRVFPPEKLDLVVVPGLLFDRNGHRLGYGGGFYDRFLAEKAPRALRVGLAFSAQLVDNVATGPHDQNLHVLITEREVLHFPA